MKTIFKTYGMLSNQELKQYEAWAIETEQYYYDNDKLPSKETIYKCICADIDIGLEDEKYNLDKELEGNILCIASIGRWNGRFQGYKLLGNNLKEILQGFACDEFHIYFDGFNIKSEGWHHDGRNYIEFRETRTDKNLDNFLEIIYSGKELTRSIINYYTKSLKPYVKAIYGW